MINHNYHIVRLGGHAQKELDQLISEVAFIQEMIKVMEKAINKGDEKYAIKVGNFIKERIGFAADSIILLE